MSPELAAGFGKEEITPDPGAHLGGYWGRSSGAVEIRRWVAWARGIDMSLPGQITGSTPSLRKASALSGERVVPITRQPFATRRRDRARAEKPWPKDRRVGIMWATRL